MVERVVGTFGLAEEAGEVLGTWSEHGGEGVVCVCWLKWQPRSELGRRREMVRRVSGVRGPQP